MVHIDEPYRPPQASLKQRKSKYLTAPPPSDRMPPGIPYIVGNEAAERFSYYGMRTILVVFMTRHLMDAHGQLAPMSEREAMTYYHLFVASVYALPLAGALLADALLGKYRTIVSLSIVYCLGHLALALDETRLGLAVGLTLIAIGSGGIKPCVSAHVGDQFGHSNRHLLEKVFGWFYFSINFGAFISTLLTPWLLDNYGPHVAFGVPGLLMLVATWVFWLGRNKFVHVPPGGIDFVREAFGAEGLKALGKLLIVYLFIAVFWSLYEQTGSAWVFQAQRMDLRLAGIDWKAAQVQAINPVLIMLYIPLFTYGIYPAINRVFPLTPLRKIGLGLFTTSAAFSISAVIQQWIDAGDRPSIAWQLVAYIVLTAAEVMVSITGLEFSYTQAPKRMKSIIMATFLLSVAVGNLFTSLVNDLIDDEKLTLEGADYYWFFTILMFGTAALFSIVSMFYRERTYLQDEASDEEHRESAG